MKEKGRIASFMAVSLAIMLVLSPGIQAQETMSKEQIESLVAPIALYPDSLLVQVLMAATYPLEVVQAARWAKANPNLKGDQLDAALQKQNWDPSVKSLMNFPQVLAMMSEKLDWTQQLGDTMLAQQKEVMGAVQALRARAQSAGTLQNTEQQKVVVQEKTIVIESAKPDVVYVPTYNPVVVYGAWPYPAYPPPPVYYPGYYPGAVVGAAAVGFATGVAMTAAWGYAWGNCNWHGGEVNINHNQNITYNKNVNNANRKDVQNTKQGNWQHNGEHRKGVAYREQNTAQKFGKGQSGSAQARQDFRGRGQGTTGGATQSPTAGTMDRPGAGQRPGGGGQTASAGQRPAGGSDRASASQRPSAGTMDRGSAGQSAGKGSSSSRMASHGGSSSAFGGMGSGSQAKSASSRGQQSRTSSFSGGGGGSRGGGGGGGSGGGRGGGGGGRR
jgi:hypothetical protein